jgi:hypothetical protein
LLYLRLELFADRPHLLLYPLPRGLPEVLRELYQDGLHGLCKVLLQPLTYSVAGLCRLSCLLCLRLLGVLLCPALQLLIGHHVLLAAKALALSCSSLLCTRRRWLCLRAPLQRRLQRLQHGRHTPFSHTVEQGLNHVVQRLKKHRPQELSQLLCHRRKGLPQALDHLPYDLPQLLDYRRKRPHYQPQCSPQGFLQRLHNRPQH